MAMIRQPIRSSGLHGFIESLPAVQHLHILGRFAYTHDLITFLSLFRGLKSLKMQGSICSIVDTFSWDGLHFDGDSLEELEMIAVRPPIYIMVVQGGFAKKLRLIQVSIVDVKEYATQVSEIISHSADTLETLKINLGLEADSVLGALVKQPLPNLRRLCFYVRDRDLNHIIRGPATIRNHVDMMRQFMINMPISTRVTDVDLGLGGVFGAFPLNAVFKDDKMWHEIVHRHIKEKFPNVKVAEVRLITAIPLNLDKLKEEEDCLQKQIGLLGVHVSITYDRGYFMDVYGLDALNESEDSEEEI